MDARRFAPCNPVQATSPTAYSPAMSVSPSTVVTTPPEPTVFDGVRNSMGIAREEIFGPVLSVIRVGSFDEAARTAALFVAPGPLGEPGGDRAPARPSE